MGETEKIKGEVIEAESSEKSNFGEFDLENQLRNLDLGQRSLIENGQKRLAEIQAEASKNGLSEEEWRAELNALDVKKKLNIFERTAKKLANKFRKIAFLTMLALSKSTAAAESEEEKNIEKIERGSEAEFEKQLAQDLLTDKFERIFVIINGEVLELPGGKELSAFLDYETIKTLAKQKNAKEVKIAHTHPLEAYKLLGFGNSSIESMRKSPEKIPPMTFSQVDVMNEDSALKFFSKAGIKTTSVVYDPTGEWEVSIDEEHLTTKIKKDMQSELDKGMLNIIGTLTPKEKELIKSVVERGDFHPLKFIEDSAGIEQLEDFSNKITEFIDELEEKYENELEPLAVFIESAIRSGILTYDSKAAKKEAISDIVKKAKGAGMHLNYIPFSP